MPEYRYRCPSCGHVEWLRVADFGGLECVVCAPSGPGPVMRRVFDAPGVVVRGGASPARWAA